MYDLIWFDLIWFSLCLKITIRSVSFPLSWTFLAPESFTISIFYSLILKSLLQLKALKKNIFKSIYTQVSFLHVSIFSTPWPTPHPSLIFANPIIPCILYICNHPSYLYICNPPLLLNICNPPSLLYICNLPSLLYICNPPSLLYIYNPPSLLYICNTPHLFNHLLRHLCDTYTLYKNMNPPAIYSIVKFML